MVIQNTVMNIIGLLSNKNLMYILRGDAIDKKREELDLIASNFKKL